MSSPHDDDISAFKVLIWDNLVEVSLKAVFVKNPWLSWGPFRWLTEFVVEKYADGFYSAASEHFDLQAMDFLNKQDRDIYIQYGSKLYTAAKDYGYYSDEYREARKNAAETFKYLVQYRVMR